MNWVQHSCNKLRLCSCDLIRRSVRGDVGRLFFHPWCVSYIYYFHNYFLHSIWICSFSFTNGLTSYCIFIQGTIRSMWWRRRCKDPMRTSTPVPSTASSRYTRVPLWWICVYDSMLFYLMGYIYIYMHSCIHNHRSILHWSISCIWESISYQYAAMFCE